MVGWAALFATLLVFLGVTVVHLWFFVLIYRILFGEKEKDD